MFKSHLLLKNIDWGLATLIAGGATVAGNIGSTLLTNSSNSSNVNATNQQSIDLWREQAAYNTPQNQMARLKAAGLNPNLAYGSLSSSNASQAPSLLAHQNVAPQVDPLTLAQIKNINADTDLKTSEADKTREETRPLIRTNDIDDFLDKFGDFREILVNGEYHNLNPHQSAEYAKILKDLSDSDISRSNAYDFLYNSALITHMLPDSMVLDSELYDSLFGGSNEQFNFDFNNAFEQHKLRHDLLVGDKNIQDITIEYNGLIRDMAKLQYSDAQHQQGIRGTLERRIASLPDNFGGNLIRLLYLFITEQTGLNLSYSSHSGSTSSGSKGSNK